MSDAAKSGADGALRIGVIGVGVMGSNHARVLSELSGVKLAGVVDPDRKTREHVARNLKCAAFADLDSLIERGVDAVTIAAPTHLHRDIAVDCAARGIHILVEKPIRAIAGRGVRCRPCVWDPQGRHDVLGGARPLRRGLKP